MSLVQIFTLITVATIAGKLRPGASTLKLKQSCEAAGSNHIPPLAYLNILIVIVTTGLYAVLVVPGLGVQRAAYNYLVCGLQVLFIWFCNWVSHKQPLFVKQSCLISIWVMVYMLLCILVTVLLQ